MKWSNILSIAISALLMTAPLTACQGETVEEERHRTFWTKGDKAINARFESCANDLFRLMAESDSVNTRFLVKDYSAYGLTRKPASLLSLGVDSDAMDGALAELEALPYEKLSRKNQIAYRLIESELLGEEGEALSYTGSNFDYAKGIQANLVTVFSEYPFYDRQDVEEYLNLLREIPDCFELCLEDEWSMIEQGYALSDDLLDLVIEQCESVYSEEECCLFPLFSEKIQRFVSDKTITPAEADEYTALHEEYVASYYIDAYRSLAEELEKMKGRCEGESGIAGYGQAGTDYYVALLQSSLGYYGDVDALFQSMEEKLDSLFKESASLVLKNRNAAIEWMNWMYGDPSKIITPSDPEKVLSIFSSSLDEGFPSIGETTYEVKYLSENMEKVYENVLAYYLIPPIDDYKNGVITVNGSICEGSSVITTIAHEGYPGHLYQNVSFLNTNPLPLRSLFSYGGYTEGWAVYAQCEALNYYEFNYANEVAADLTRNETVLNYLVCAVIDIGVNYYGWNTAELADYMNRNGLNGDVAGELRQIVVSSPALYLDYGAGGYEMYRLREYAESQKLFSLKEFHSLILEIGPCGFDLLEELVCDYYEGANAA
ncbi:MAG: DUF885 domain-containing protein [Clostridia bacterium]|nr:DUF885 domain-containing protein [Clostridia bacterium]